MGGPSVAFGMHAVELIADKGIVKPVMCEIIFASRSGTSWNEQLGIAELPDAWGL